TMEIKQHIKDFEKMGFGMFVHFGIYSCIGRGEWVRHNENIPREEYDKNMAKFKVKKNLASEPVGTAKQAWCK
ncbi:MAG: alpha-L-fucosidase, partial [Clostridia bacterium]|nr:alpha-L-fucosidase [Clostridia bacterium]